MAGALACPAWFVPWSPASCFSVPFLLSVALSHTQIIDLADLQEVSLGCTSRSSKISPMCTCSRTRHRMVIVSSDDAGSWSSLFPHSGTRRLYRHAVEEVLRPLWETMLVDAEGFIGIRSLRYLGTPVFSA